MMHCTSRAAAVLAAALALPAAAQDARSLYAASLAATCANCHGTNGHSVVGSAPPGLAGLNATYFTEQIKAFKSVGAFPSQQAALTSPELASVKNAFFNNAPTGTIFAERAKAVTVTPYKGPKYFPVNDAMQQALTRVEDKSMTPDKSWERFVNDVKALG